MSKQRREILHDTLEMKKAPIDPQKVKLSMSILMGMYTPDEIFEMQYKRKPTDIEREFINQII